MMTASTFRNGALVASLMLNTFLAGFLISHHRPDQMMPPPPGRMAERLADRLPEKDAEILRAAFESRKQAEHDARESMKDFRERMRDLLVADPFDANAFADLLHEAHAAGAKAFRLHTEAMIEAAAKMSPEGRKALAEGPGPMGPMGPEGPGGPGGRPHGPGGPDGPPPPHPF